MNHSLITLQFPPTSWKLQMRFDFFEGGRADAGDLEEIFMF
jgi:hypothetical protein